MDDYALLAKIVDHMTHIGITPDDIQSLLVNQLGLSAYCPHCRLWAGLDLAGLAAPFRFGSRPLRGFRVRCRQCDGRGSIQVRPPTRTWGGA